MDNPFQAPNTAREAETTLHSVRRARLFMRVSVVLYIVFWGLFAYISSVRDLLASEEPPATVEDLFAMAGAGLPILTFVVALLYGAFITRHWIRFIIVIQTFLVVWSSIAFTSGWSKSLWFENSITVGIALATQMPFIWVGLFSRWAAIAHFDLPVPARQDTVQ